MINGAITAIITPMKDNGEVDFDEFERLLQFQAENGVAGVVVNGTTGESPTLETSEQEKLLTLAVQKFKKDGSRFVIAGTGTNSTDKTIKNTEAAKKIGADAVLVVTPYYNKPNEKGLIKHFRLAADVGLPVIVYDIVGRTGRQIKTNEFVEIAKHPNIIGVKAASGNLDQIKDLMENVAEPIRKTGREFYVWSGDDGITRDVVEMGGNGVISVISNLVPAKVQALASEKNPERGRALADELAPLAKAAFIETNPVPIKYMLKLAGLIKSDFVRLPLGELLDASKRHIESAVKNMVA